MLTIWHKVRGYLATGLALAACPCHLAITLPLLLPLTAGTALGAFFSRNTSLIVAVSDGDFRDGAAAGLPLNSQKGKNRCPNRQDW